MVESFETAMRISESDPAATPEKKAGIRALVASGSTVLLTTQYLDEADQLVLRLGLGPLTGLHGRCASCGRGR